MTDFPSKLDALNSEIIKKALVWYYRAWSYYWGQEPKACSIYAAESFVQLEDEVLCFLPRDLTSEDITRLQGIFALKLSFIAERLASDQSGYSVSRGEFQSPTPLLRRIVDQMRRDYLRLRTEVTSWRLEKRRQEWVFGQSGRYAEYLDGYSRLLYLTPKLGKPYGFLMNRTGIWRFSAGPPETAGAAVRWGGFRRHWNDVGREKVESLDLFPESGDPRLWRLARVGAGYKITRRETPQIPRESGVPLSLPTNNGCKKTKL